MSTKTTFKRIALVAVAALGLGVLSVAPSSAVVTGTAITVDNNGTATFRSGTSGVVDSDTTTGAQFTVTGLVTSTTDTITVTFYEKSRPATASATERAVMQVIDTTTANTYVSANAAVASVSYGASAATTFASGVTTASNMGRRVVGSTNNTESVTAGSVYQILSGGSVGALTRGSTTGPIGAKFDLFLESNSAHVVGSYVYTVVATTYSNTGGSNYNVTSNQTDVTIVVGATAATTAAALKTPAAANATAFIGTATGPTTDATVSVVATASTTSVAFIAVKENNTNGTASVAEDSLTATLTGPGLVCSGSVCGKSLTAVALTAGAFEFTVRADGTAGVATIAISSTVTTFASKTVTFFAKSAKTLTPTVRHPVLGIGGNTGAVGVAAVDANGIAWTGLAYIYATSAASALIAGSETPVACSAWTSANGIRCDVTGKLVGTAKFKIIDASTVAAATATSDEITLTVSAGSPGSVKIAFDKATYAPFEKAKITVTVLDTAGSALPAQTIASVFTSGGITSTVGFSANSDTLTATSVILQSASSSTSGAVAGSQIYYVYMPAGSGTVTISATGDTGLASAGRVAVTASAEVVNSSVDAATDAANEATDAANAATDAALAAADAADAATAAAEDASAAVATLAASVSEALGNLKKQISALTALVNKLLKKK